MIAPNLRPPSGKIFDLDELLPAAEVSSVLIGGWPADIAAVLPREEAPCLALARLVLLVRVRCGVALDVPAYPWQCPSLGEIVQHLAALGHHRYACRGPTRAELRACAGWGEDDEA